MIEKETVFILGAGASKPYGFPTGQELRKKIIQHFEEDLNSILESDRDLFKDEPNFSVSQRAKSFLVQFDESDLPIDLFLSLHSELSSEYEDIGKMAIVMRILKAEEKSYFREAVDSKMNWYKELWRLMRGDIISAGQLAEFKANNVTFITFNYDRSLEHYLYTVLRNSFLSISDPAMSHLLDILNEIPIHHVYGKIDWLIWERGNHIASEYGSPNYYRADIITRLIDNIRIIHDDDRAQGEIAKAQRAIENAKRIYFLGFGFASENLEVLDIPDVFSHSQKIYGTTLGMSENQRMALITKWCDGKKKFRIEALNNTSNTTNCLLIREPKTLEVTLRSCNCLELLNEYPLE